jgi:hypothetical protein
MYSQRQVLAALAVVLMSSATAGAQFPGAIAGQRARARQ